MKNPLFDNSSLQGNEMQSVVGTSLGATLPKRIQRIAEGGVSIVWGDELTQSISALTLRTLCPCAECRQKRGEGDSHSRPLTSPVKKNVGPLKPGKRSLLKIVEHEAHEELKLERIWAIGNYAIGISWGDGHSSGIYSYSYLRELGDDEQNKS